MTSGDTTKTRYLFTSRELDTATKRQYNPARYYDVAVGRWISEDPLGFTAGDANVGRYVGNEATGATDPSGLQPPIILPNGNTLYHCVPLYGPGGTIFNGVGAGIGRYPNLGGDPELGYGGNALVLTFAGDYGEADPNAAGIIGSIALGGTGQDVYKDVADIV